LREHDVRTVTRGTFQTTIAITGASLAVTWIRGHGVGALVAVCWAVVGGWVGEAIGGTVGNVVTEPGRGYGFPAKLDSPVV
jgi:hypothetical protein